MRLTLAYIKKAIANDPRFDQDIDLDEYGKAIVCTAPGYTWYAADGDLATMGFIISKHNADGDEQDTVAYWKERVSFVEPCKEA